MSQELKELLDEIYAYLISKLDDLETLDQSGIANQISSLISNLIFLLGKILEEQQ